jgi:hypothetical protein
MRYLIIFTILLACGRQRSWSQDTAYFLRNRIGEPKTAVQVMKPALGQPGARSLAPDTALDLRMRKERLKALADTSKFAPNRENHWSLFNSYVAAEGRDKIVLEATIEHDRDGNWGEYLQFGRIIDKKLWPREVQEVQYYLLTDLYGIRIEPDGRCSIKLLEGQLPQTDPVILPIRITFKGK